MLSIIIPVYNQHDMTDECIQAVRENTSDYELIIIDNGSEPAIKKPFTGFVDTTVIRNEKNLGFPVAVNQGIRAANGDIIILLNNDVIVTPGWSERLVKWLYAEKIEVTELGDSEPAYIDKYQPFSIVGPCTNYAAGIQGVTTGIYNSIAELNDEAREWSESYDGAIEEVNFVIGFCMVFKKSLYDEIGEFDESLWPCSCEEIDFCFKTIEAGHKIGVAYDVYVHHFGSQTFEQMQESGQLNYKNVCKMCDEHLAKKWGNDFWQRQVIERENDNEEIKAIVNG